MEYLGSCRWFNDVKWEEQGYFVDCLADLCQMTGEGYFLVLEGYQFKIRSGQQLKELSSLSSLHILGKAIKWTYSLQRLKTITLVCSLAPPADPREIS